MGRRVSVRRVLERDPDGRLRFGDVVGDLLTLDAELAVLDTRAGIVEVPVELVAVARLAPPSTADELALEAVVARGWRPAESGSIGGWQLRASNGFTARGNSVLPLRAPGRPLDDALAAAAAWYAARDLPLLFQVPVEARRLLDNALGERGFAPVHDTHVLTARLDVLRRAAPEAGPDVHLVATPDDTWLRRLRNGGGLEPAARALLARHDRAVFAVIRDHDGSARAIGRGTIDDDWLGVTAVEVAPDQRRRGLARAIMQALWGWADTAGAKRSHLEVDAENAAALALYERLGYRTHHDYRYRIAP